MPENFLESLQRADSALQQESLSSEADAKLQRRLLEASQPVVRKPRRWIAWQDGLWGSLAMALGAVCVVWWMKVPPTSQRSMLAGFALVQGQASAPAQVLICASTSCRLRFDERQTKIVVARDTRVERRNRNLRVWRGKVELSVSPQAPKTQPFRIYVSHGRIEVMGTRFTVLQRAQRGQVTLHHGEIRFVHLSGQVEYVQPGQTLHWPRVSVSALKRRSRASVKSITSRTSAQRNEGLLTQTPSAKVRVPRPSRVMATISPAPRPTRRRMFGPAPRRPRPMQRPHRQRVAMRLSVRGENRRLVRRAVNRRRKAQGLRQVFPVARRGMAEHPSTPKEVTSPSAGPLQPKPSAPSVRAAPSVSAIPSVKPVPSVKSTLMSTQAVARLLERLAGLRAQGRYSAVIGDLEKALPKLRGTTKERLSYELGAVLTFQLRQRVRACRHWRRHLRQFATSTRYAQEILRWRQSLRCAP